MAYDATGDAGPQDAPPAKARRHRGRGALKIAGIALAVLLALLLVAVFVLPKTGPGQGLIDRIARPIIEDQVRAQLGSDIDFAPIAGALPGELVLKDIALSADGEDWLRVARVRLGWSPLALIGGDIVVDSLVISDADLLRMPPPRPEQPEKPEETPQPLNLPSVRVDRFVVDPLTIREPVLGEAYVLSLTADLAAAGQDIAANAEVATASGSDRVSLAAEYDPERLSADLRVAGAAEGLIANLSGAGGPVSVTLDGEGALADWGGTLRAALGRYGEADARLSGDLAELTNARLVGMVRPGPGLPEAVGQVAGEALTLDVATRRDGEALAVAIETLEGRFGGLSGTVRLGSLSAETVAADLSGTISEAVATEFGAPFAAGPVALTAEAAQADGGWRADGTLETAGLTATVTDGVTNPDTAFAGRVGVRSDGLSLGQERLDPILAQGAVASADIRYPAEGPVRVTDIDARLGSGARLVNASGEATYDTLTQAFDARLDARAARGALETLLGTGSYDGPLNLTVTAKGTPQDADVTARAAIPSGTLDGVAFGAGQLTADVAGLPEAPSGTAAITSEDGGYEGRVELVRDGAVVRVPALRFASGGLTLDGQGVVNPETRALSAELSLDAGERTTLITGQTVGGQAEMRAEVGAEGGPVDIAVTVRNLAFEENTIEDARITARGPMSAIAFDVDAGGVVAADRFLPYLRASGVADVATEQRVIELAAFETALDGEDEADRIALSAPTRIALGEVVEVGETRIDWLGDGRVVAQGRYAPDLWVAEVTAEALTLPGQPFTASLTASVDSRNDEVATFAARVVSDAEELPETYALTAEGAWSGETLRAEAALAPEGGEALGTAEVAFPLTLTRTDGTLGVAIPEEGLDGRVRYASDLGPLYAFAGMAETPLTGRLDADVALAGAVTAPEARGTARLTDGDFEEDQFGFALRRIGVEAEFAYTGTETVATLTGQAADAEGDAEAVRLSGDVRIGAEDSAVDVRVALDDAQLADSAALELQADGALALTGPLTDLLFAGTINIDELDAAIPSIETTEGAPEYVAVNVVRVDAPERDRVGEVADAPPPPLTVALDLAITANNAVFVRGRGLDSEWRIDMTVGGTNAAPVLGGEVALLEGTFDFAGREFAITEGFVDFQGGDAINPRLNVQAEYETDEVTAIVRVTGPAQDPEIELTSNPPRPQEDVMALILFGKQPSDLTALESLQIANAIAKLSGKSPLGGGGPGITDKLRSGLGLDALSLGVGEDGNANVGVGKYVTDDLYVSARQSAGEVGTEVIVTYEFTDELTVEGVTRPDGAQGVSANYRLDY